MASQGWTVNNSARSFSPRARETDTRYLRKEVIEPVEQIDKRGDAETDPHRLAPEKAAPPACHLQRQLNKRIAQPLVFRPLFPQDEVDSQHHRKQRKQKATPQEHRRGPRPDVRREVQRGVPAIQVIQRSLVSDRQPLGECSSRTAPANRSPASRMQRRS